MKPMIWILAMLFFTNTILGQTNFVCKDTVYQPNIATVLTNQQGKLPIIGFDQVLRVQFDELDQEERYVRYLIEHCDRYWKPSGLTEMDYLDGFNDNQLLKKEYSLGTIIPYIQYSISIPNRDVNVKLSGNYVLHIYDEDTGEPLISQRFMLLDQQLGTSLQQIRPAIVEKVTSHQQIVATVNNQQYIVKNPIRELEAVILQNGRWDNAAYRMPDNAAGPKIDFGRLKPIYFEAGKEFDLIDFRELNNYCDCADSIRDRKDGIFIDLTPKMPRAGMPYLYTRDIDGQYFSQRNKYFNQDGTTLNAEYLNIRVKLRAFQEYFDRDVFVVGAFNNWQQDATSEMVFNDADNSYECELLLRQGVYDFGISVTADPAHINLAEIDGNWYETQNRYDILIYYRPLGALYDQLISFTSVDFR